MFRADRLAVFVHGCFWHRHEGCPHCRTPKSRVDFWEEKFAANVRRDQAAAANLEALGWTVMTVWECEARDEIRRAAFVDRVDRARGKTQEGRALTKSETREDH